MRRIVLSSTVTSCLALALLAGCAGDDTEAPLPDAGTTIADAGHDATTSVDTGVDGESDDASPATDAPTEAAVDAGGPKYLTLSYEFDSYKETEYAAFSLGLQRAAGHLQYASFGVNMSTALGPWALEQKNDLVLKLDPANPWIPTASWSVASPAPDAGGLAYADAMSVAETATHAYLALYNRNAVAVLDTTTSPDGGAPSSLIDLSGFLQAADADHSVEASAALYDSATKRVWIVLQNINEDAPYGGPPDYDAQCTPGLVSTVVAIDTTTNALVPNLQYKLTGTNPGRVILDPISHRLVLVDAGCTAAPDAGDAGPGPLTGRMVESLDLGTGASTVLLDGTKLGRPGGFAYASNQLAFVTFGSATYAWDPMTPTLGAALPTTPDAFTWDGKGLLGPKASTLGDGGVSIAVIRVDPLTGVVTTIGANPVSAPDSTGFFESVDLWPRP